MTLEAILFDFGNTLVSTRLDWAKILPQNMAGLAATMGEQLPSVDFGRLGRDLVFLRQAAGQRAQETMIETPATESLKAALALQRVSGVGRDVLQLGVDGFFAAEEAAYPIIFGVPEMLARLRAMGFTLGVVSNATCGKLIRRALERRLMLGMFDVVTVSAEVGSRKPDAAIFGHALSALGLEAAACAMVGDLPDKDIAGARRAGMRSVLADFFGDQPEITPQGPRPDAVVRHPGELVGLFEQWRGKGEA
ncbi:MAG TPA: HAD family hydrolase [Myxococcota bacterium]|nr:HAD family hydrolase [Myxococcota bacterium]